MRRGGAVLVAALVVLGLLGVAGAQGPEGAPSSPPAAKERPWPELEDEYRSALTSYGLIADDLYEVEARLRATELELAPLQAEVARLQSLSRPVAGDSELADAMKRLHEKLDERRFGENTVRRDALVESRMRARGRVIESGSRALNAMFRAAERMSEVQRAEQRDVILKKAAAIMERVDRLEHVAPPIAPPVVPFPVGNSVRTLDKWINTYEDEAKGAAAVVEDLSRSIELKTQEQEHLSKLRAAGVMMNGRIPETLERVTVRLDELRRAREAWEARTRVLRSEGNKLKQRKLELEKQVGKSPAPGGDRR